MRTCLLTGLLLLGSTFFTGGCATPAYSANERGAQIARTWSVDAHEAVDDFDALFLLRPPSRMTIWHIR